MKTTPVIILAAIVVIVVGGVMWFLQTSPVTETANVSPTPALEKRTSEPVPQAVRGTPIQAAPRNTGEPVVAQNEPPSPPMEARPLTEWEERIDKVLRINATETEAAQLLINMLPTLPAEGQAEAAQHISNLILDTDYNRVLPLVRNPALPEEVHDVLFTDLMNREDTVKLPTLLEVAKIPNHPYHDEALTDLQIFLDQDFENNWGKWDAAVKDYLKKQAAENAAANAPDPAGAPPVVQ